MFPQPRVGGPWQFTLNISRYQASSTYLSLIDKRPFIVSLVAFPNWEHLQVVPRQTSIVQRQYLLYHLVLKRGKCLSYITYMK